MSAPAAYTLTNPTTGNLAFKIQPFSDNSRFDHLQRLNYYSIIVLEQGRARLSVDFSEYLLSPGTLLFFAPYQAFMLDQATDIRGVAVHFHPDFFCIHHHQKEVACNGVLFNNIYRSPAMEIEQSDLNRFLQLIEAMKPEVEQVRLAQYEALIAYLKLFLIQATRLKELQEHSVTELSTDKRKLEIARDLRDAIEAHYRARHSASEYAGLLNVSPKTLARVSQSIYHKTLTSLIAERIIIEAKRELYQTSKTVKEIAWLLGFEDEFYFSRLFKNNAGISPQLFRDTVGFGRAEPSAS
jgi:AraC family transcriptional activator of pobA